MRNWNKDAVNQFKNSEFVFTVPMRNWNRFLTGYQVLVEKGFYSTYEELKLYIIYIIYLYKSVFLQYLWGIETFFLGGSVYSRWAVFTVPMRNWNQAPTSIGWGSWLCFYSTYEELKRFNGLDKVYIPNEFLQYLWGIETSDNSSFQQILLYVFTVPMRNWNFE